MNGSILKIMLNYLIKNEDSFCMLCLIPTSDHGISLDDEVEIARPYHHEFVSYTKILTDLGVEKEPLLPNKICASCATTIAHTYMYKHLHQYHTNKWSEMLTKLQKALELTSTMSSSAKLVYIVMTGDQNLLLSSRSKSKIGSLSKFKEILKYRKSYYGKKPLNIVCEECGEQFECKRFLSKHCLKVHCKVRFPCRACPRILRTHSQLKAHEIKSHQPKKVNCTKCDKKFSNQKLLDCHNTYYHMAVICQLCFKQFPSKKDLRTHLNKHDENVCLRCNKSFINKVTFKMHKNICGNEEHRKLKFFCDLCGKGYVQKANLRSHIKTDHDFGVNMHICKYCNKKFDAVSKLRNHIITHTRERNFSCSECGNMFVSQAALLYHTRLHTGEKPYKCDLCEESFVSASRRMEHKKRKHIGPTIECSICHAMFVLNSQLKKHVVRHNDPLSKLYVPVNSEHI